MLFSVVLAFIIYWLSNTFIILKGNPYANFILWSVIVFVVAGGFVVRTLPEDQRRTYWLY
jgi:hypothetical protein